MPHVENSAWARVYGDLGTAIWVAPKGSTLPVDLAEPVAAFKSLGWVDPDTGVVMSVAKEIQSFKALQGGTVIRRKVTSVEQTIKFAALEESQIVQKLVWADQPITISGTAPDQIAKQDIVADQARTIEKAAIIDTIDGAIWTRYCFSALDFTFQGDLMLAKNDALKMFPFECGIIGGSAGYQLTNSPGMLVAA